MGSKHFLFACATLSWFYLIVVPAQERREVKIPVTSFTCSGRASGYYADIETGCQVYHMCDGLGRQFSYTCPNTTLFQQRMLICDHWYMVNCSMSERDYDANLLIGQRDKPFVSDEEMRLRTPRPDILSVPPKNNYYDGLREAESKFPVHPGNSIVGIADAISSANNNGLDSAKVNYRPPSSWSTGSGQTRLKPNTNNGVKEQDTLTGEASLKPSPTFQPTPADSKFVPNITSANPPSLDLRPPRPPPTTTEAPIEEMKIDLRFKDPKDDPVFKFIKRFDPNSPDSHKTAMSRSEIIDLNKELPQGQASSEEERTPKKFKNADNSINTVGKDNDKGFNVGNRFDSVNSKPIPTESSSTIKMPDRELVPPKSDYSDLPSTTMGPPIYYEWKWAVPAFDLQPPKESNATNSTSTLQARSVDGKSPFRDVTRSTISPDDATPKPTNTEYNISSYYVPDYVFPLDKHHPGYDNEEARTSFQVQVSRPGRASYGENPACPQCHPGYLVPGTCEPCIVKR